jgi:phospholipid/cholesterol/gamma-HCH transport system substrate-binding protein
MSVRGISRSTLIQLTVFVLIGVLCTAYVGTRVLGANPITRTYRVSVSMADTGGLTPTSEVTYRGVSVGTVEATRVVPGMAGVRIDLRLREGTPIPASSRAVVSMENAIAITKLDLRPAGGNPPFLHDGSEIASEATSRPLPLDTVLADFLRLADSVDTRDLQRLSTEVSAALNGTSGDLQRILSDAGPLLDALNRTQPTLVDLSGNVKSLLDTANGINLRQVTASMRGLTDTLRGQTPAVESLLVAGPPLAAQVVPMLQQAQPSVPVLLANLVSASQILTTRVPALNELLVAMPSAVHGLAGIEHNGVANFYLVGALGPACYYDTKRRPATEAGPRDPQTNWSCRGDQTGLQQRGAANAPRPGVAPQQPTNDASTSNGAGFTLGANGGQAGVLGPRSWYALLLQGAQGGSS